MFISSTIKYDFFRCNSFSCSFLPSFIQILLVEDSLFLIFSLLAYVFSLQIFA